MHKISPKISIDDHKMEISPMIHPSLLMTINMYKNMPDFLPSNFPDLIPTLTDFLSYGIVPDKLINDLKYTNSFKLHDNFYLHNLRTEFIKDFGFVLLSHPLIETVSKQLENRKVLEIGAGTGFLAKQLIDKNVNLIAIDHQANKTSEYGFDKQHTEIVSYKAASFLNRYKNNFDTFILSWPDYSTDMAAKVLEKMQPKQRLYYVGESEGGCTANDRFFYLLERKAQLNQTLTDELTDLSLSWPGIHDRWQVYDIIT